MARSVKALYRTLRRTGMIDYEARSVVTHLLMIGHHSAVESFATMYVHGLSHQLPKNEEVA